MIDDGKLESDRAKRDLPPSHEPDGSTSFGGEKPIFVIQEHDASSHHFDLRLEIDGVLKSWAVPKGPSTDPSNRRLAIPTEDHPMDSADFEGVIPEGEYGGGPVLLWDRGGYRNLRADSDDDAASMAESYDDGKIEVWLEGEKISGGYALVRTDTGDDGRWLLIKMDDDEADARRNPTSTEPESVASGRDIDEVAEDSEADDGS